MNTTKIIGLGLGFLVATSAALRAQDTLDTQVVRSLDTLRERIDRLGAAVRAAEEVSNAADRPALLRDAARLRADVEAAGSDFGRLLDRARRECALSADRMSAVIAGSRHLRERFDAHVALIDSARRDDIPDGANRLALAGLVERWMREVQRTSKELNLNAEAWNQAHRKAREAAGAGGDFGDPSAGNAYSISATHHVAFQFYESRRYREFLVAMSDFRARLLNFERPVHADAERLYVGYLRELMAAWRADVLRVRQSQPLLFGVVALRRIQDSRASNSEDEDEKRRLQEIADRFAKADYDLSAKAAQAWQAQVTPYSPDSGLNGGPVRSIESWEEILQRSRGVLNDHALRSR